MSSVSKKRWRVFLAGVIAVGCGGTLASAPTSCTITFRVQPEDISHNMKLAFLSMDPETYPDLFPDDPATLIESYWTGWAKYEIAVPLFENGTYYGTLMEVVDGSAINSVGEPDIVYDGRATFDAGWIDWEP